jgi:hypothetical protein
MMRSLLTTRRHVPLDIADEYLLAWQTVQRMVEAAGGRAWIFRGAAHEDQFLEFIEWTHDVDPPAQSEDVQAALSQLDSFATSGNSEEWEDAS